MRPPSPKLRAVGNVTQPVVPWWTAFDTDVSCVHLSILHAYAFTRTADKCAARIGLVRDFP